MVDSSCGLRWNGISTLNTNWGVPVKGYGGSCTSSPEGPAVATPPAPVSLPVVGGKFTFSDYGKFIPLVYGSFVVQGNVFWQGTWRLATYQAAAGVPAQVYVTDFAVGLCEGMIDDVLRIWVGDVLVYDKRIDSDIDGIAIPDADGIIGRATFNYEAKLAGLLSGEDQLAVNDAQAGIQTRIAIYNGSEYQMPPDKMAAVEGFEDTPGYRGTAYILFENFFQAENSAPNIRVEVLANAGNNFARIDLAFEDNGFFSTAIGEELAYDASLNVIYASTQDGSTEANAGAISINAADLTQVADHRWYDTMPLGTPLGLSTSSFFDAISNGNIVFGMFEGNDGRMGTASPWGQTGLGDLQAASSIPTTHQSTGPGAVGPGSTVFRHTDDDGVPVDVAVMNTLIGGDNAIGFALIYADGTIDWKDYANNILAQNQGTLSNDTNNHFIPLLVDPDFAKVRPTFSDGAKTEGGHIYCFTIVGEGAAEFDYLYIDRVTFQPAPATTQAEADDPNRASFDNIQHEYIGAISLDEIGGRGTQHTIIHAFLDPIDKCFVLTIKIGSEDETVFSDRIVKWNPYVGRFVYNKALSAILPSGVCRGNARGKIALDRQWAYPSPASKIVLVDLAYGDSYNVINDTDAAGIGALSAFSPLEDAIWLGDEGALIIPMSQTFGSTNLTKVFITRRGNAVVPLGDVIGDLLYRSGWDPSSILFSTDINDFDVRGYAILSEKDVRTAISELKQVFGFEVVESNGAIQYTPRGSSPILTVPYEHLKQDDANGPLTEIIDTDVARLRKVSLKYFDIDREYAENVQTAILPEIGQGDFSAESFIDVTVPLVLTAAEAKLLAESIIYQKTVYETNYSFALPPKYMILDPGDVIEVEDGADTLQMRVRSVELGADEDVRIEAASEDPDIYNDTVTLFAELGRFNDNLVPTPPPVVFFAPVAIPYISELFAEAQQDSLNYYLWFFDYNPAGQDVDYDKTWKIYIGGTLVGTSLSGVPRPTWGYVLETPESTGPLYSTDTRSTVTIKLVEQGDLLIADLADEFTMINNPTFNLAYVNGEVIQFQNATVNGDDTISLTVLHRARFGTDAAARAHTGRGGQFVLLTDATGVFGNPPRVTQVPFPQTDGPERSFTAVLLADKKSPFQISPTFTYESTLFKPWSPGGMTYEVNAGDVILAWERRVRFDGNWLDDGDATLAFTDANPLGGYNEKYEWFLTDSPVTGVDAPTTYLRTGTLTDTSTFTYTAAEQTADGVDITADTLYLYVRFIGGKTGQETGWPGKLTIWPVQ